MSGIRTYVGPYEVGERDRRRRGRPRRRLERPGLRRRRLGASGLGWRERGVAAAHLRKLDPDVAPPSTALGVLGMPGLTAWVGLVDIGAVQGRRDDVRLGCRRRGRERGGADREAEGAARDRQRRSPEKVEWLRSLGIEAFDYRETRPKDALADGIDVYFDNVGGSQLEAALFALRPFGRVVACGAISRYNDERPEPGPRNLGLIVTKRLRVQGFIVIDHSDRFRRSSPRSGRGCGTGRSPTARRSWTVSSSFRGVRRPLHRRQRRQDARPRRS